MRVRFVPLLALLVLLMPSSVDAQAIPGSPQTGVAQAQLLVQPDSGAIVSATSVQTTAQASGTWELLNPPAARSQHSAVWDPTNGQMLVFGGQDGARLNDLWSLRPSTTTWTLLAPTGDGPPPVTGHSAVWDPVRSQMLIYGGLGGGEGELWAYQPAGNAWTALNPSGRHPDKRGYHSAVWDTANDQMLVFGGIGSSFAVFEDVWAYRPATDSWVTFAPRGSRPIGRFYQGATWDPERAQMLMFGGIEPSSGRRLDDLWSYKPASATWAQLTTGERPPERLSHSMVWDPVADQVILFGGGCGAGCYRSDIWAYKPATNTWSPLPVKGTAPAARGGHSGVWDASAGRLIIFAGSQPKGTLNDFWSYQPSLETWAHLDLDPPSLPLTGDATSVWDTQSSQLLLVDSLLQLAWTYQPGDNTWSERAPIGPTPPTREGFTAVWDPDRAQLLVFGGRSQSGLEDSLWSYQPVSNRWTRLTPTGELPTARWRHSAVWDSDAQRMIVFGGSGASGLLDDLWAYRPASNTWEQLASATPAPDARQGQSAAWSDGRMLVFGGEAGTPLDDLWSFEDTTWRRLTPEGERPAARVGAVAVWNPLRNELIVTGGSAVADDRLWAYNPSTDAWTSRRSGGLNVLVGRDVRTAAWDPVGERVLGLSAPRNMGGAGVEPALSSGLGGQPSAERVGTQAQMGQNQLSPGRLDLWAYRPNDDAWELLGPSRAVPAARQSLAAVWDPQAAELLIFGGLVSSEDFLDDLWGFRASSRAWYRINVAGDMPPEVSNHAAVWDSMANDLYAWGGFGPAGYLRDVWTYRKDSNEWALLAAGETVPPDREDHSAVWDDQDGRMLVFGGAREGRPFDDLWSFDPVDNSWTELMPDGPTPAPRFRHTAVWDAEGARMLVFGGYGGAFPGGYLNDLWSYDPALNAWTELEFEGEAPSPRATHGAAWDADNGRLFVMGGFAGGIDYLGDVWSYDVANAAWTNLTPDGEEMPTPRASHSAVWDGERLLVYGGQSGGLLGELWGFIPPSP